MLYEEVKAVEDDLFNILSKFVILAGSIDYGLRLIKILPKLFKAFKNLKIRRLFKRKK